MVTKISQAPKGKNFGPFLLGKYAIFKSKNQVSLYWCEAAEIVNVTKKIVYCLHPKNSDVYAYGNGRFKEPKPIVHRISSLIAVTDSLEDIENLSQINVLYVKNHILAQVIFVNRCNDTKVLKKILNTQEQLLLSLT